MMKVLRPCSAALWEVGLFQAFLTLNPPQDGRYTHLISGQTGLQEFPHIYRDYNSLNVNNLQSLKPLDLRKNSRVWGLQISGLFLLKVAESLCYLIWSEYVKTDVRRHKPSANQKRERVLSHGTPSHAHVFLLSRKIQTFHSLEKIKMAMRKRVRGTKTAAVYENLQLCLGSLRLARLGDWLLRGHVDSRHGNLFPMRL